jgi:putative membrane protein
MAFPTTAGRRDRGPFSRNSRAAWTRRSLSQGVSRAPTIVSRLSPQNSRSCIWLLLERRKHSGGDRRPEQRTGGRRPAVATEPENRAGCSRDARQRIIALQILWELSAARAVAEWQRPANAAAQKGNPVLAQKAPPRISALSDAYLPCVVSAAALLVGCAGALLAFDLGPLSRPMLFHIVAMNLAAPISAIAIARLFCSENNMDLFRRLLWPATVTQVVLLWAWHAPLSGTVRHQPVHHAGMLASLFLVASTFWLAVLARLGRSAWQSILALLATGKLVCLLGTLLVFAPRSLYSVHTGLESSDHSAIADQQLAGLLMIAACPLSYVLAGVVQSVQLIQILGKNTSVTPSVPHSR